MVVILANMPKIVPTDAGSLHEDKICVIKEDSNHEVIKSYSYLGPNMEKSSKETLWCRGPHGSY
jgi:hypothetical protein